MTTIEQLSGDIIKQLKKYSYVIICGDLFTGKKHLIRYTVKEKLKQKTCEIDCSKASDRDKLQNKLYGEDEVIVLKNAGNKNNDIEQIYDLIDNTSVKTVLLYDGSFEEAETRFSETPLKRNINKSYILMPSLYERKDEMFAIVESFLEDEYKKKGTGDCNKVTMAEEMREFFAQFDCNINNFAALKKVVEDAYLLVATEEKIITKKTMNEALAIHNKRIAAAKRCKNYGKNFKDGICTVESEYERLKEENKSLNSRSLKSRQYIEC
jgi:hypothetical protein